MSRSLFYCVSGRSVGLSDRHEIYARSCKPLLLQKGKIPYSWKSGKQGKETLVLSGLKSIHQSDLRITAAFFILFLLLVTSAFLFSIHFLFLDSFTLSCSCVVITTPARRNGLLKVIDEGKTRFSHCRQVKETRACLHCPFDKVKKKSIDIRVCLWMGPCTTTEKISPSFPSVTIKVTIMALLLRFLCPS